MSSSPPRRFGFSEVVGQDDLKLALLLAAIDPAIGGVLLRGDKGAGKTTLARAFAALLPGSAPFVELPLGATEDRVLGSIDLGAALTTGEERVRPGLLAAAHGGVLYVDEVNLLADHLVDTLLDVAVSGEHRLERDGVSVVQPARFVLVGTMNPEEGELRPQLLDRFGLCVTVSAPADPAVRAEIVRAVLGADSAGIEPDVPQERGARADTALRERLQGARPADVDDGTIDFAARLAVASGAEGVRGDIVLCRAAAALAGWEGRAAATSEDVERVAPLVLAHRHRRSPFDPPTLSPDALDDALSEARSGSADDRADGPADSPADGGDPGAGTGPNGAGGAEPDGGAGEPGEPGERRGVEMGGERRAPVLPAGGNGAPGGSPGRSRSVVGARGRAIRDEPFRPDAPGGVAVAATVREVARRRATDPAAVPEVGDLRSAVREDRAGTLVVIALDTSGSMGARDRVRAATGAVLGLLTDAYQRRDRVAVVTFDGTGARVALAPTGSVEVARARLAALDTGGTTPLGAGLATALGLAARRTGNGDEGRSVLVVITDGRATGADDAADEALAAAADIRAAGVPALVLDAETGVPRLGLAARLADAMGAACRPIADLTAGTLHQLTRTV
jgi:magnesium chelatase subunit D